MTDFERNYFGKGPRPATMAIQRKRGVLVRTNSNRESSQLTDEWQPQQAGTAGSTGSGVDGDRRTSSLRRPQTGNSSASSGGVTVKKEVNFLSPTKSEAEPAKCSSSSALRQSTFPRHFTTRATPSVLAERGLVVDPKTDLLANRLLQKHEARSRQNSENGNSSSFNDQPLGNSSSSSQLRRSSSAAEEDSSGEVRRLDGDDDGSRLAPIPRAAGYARINNQNENCYPGDKESSRTGGGGGDHSLNHGDWNTATEAISYYSDSTTGSNSATMADQLRQGTIVPAPPASSEINRRTKIHSSSWSLSSNCGRQSQAAAIHDDNSRFGTIRSIQSECRTSSTSHLNRSGSLKRIRGGRSNQSLCSCDAEIEVTTRG